MLNSLGWLGGLQDFSVRPRPFGTNWGLELMWTRLGLGLGGLRLINGLGPGLDNYTFLKSS